MAICTDFAQIESYFAFLIAINHPGRYPHLPDAFFLYVKVLFCKIKNSRTDLPFSGFSSVREFSFLILCKLFLLSLIVFWFISPERTRSLLPPDRYRKPHEPEIPAVTGSQRLLALQ